MEHSALTNISPLDGRYAKLCEPLRTIASEFGLIRYRLKIELAWFKALSQNHDIQECPALEVETLQYLDGIEESFSVQEAQEVKDFENTTNHDVKAVEYFLKKRFEKHPLLQPVSEFIHFACTSEDINNLSYALMLKDLRYIMLSSLQDILGKLNHLVDTTKNIPLLSWTHGQAASPTTLGKEIVNVKQRLLRQMTQLEALPILGKINGAVGNYNAHVVAYPKLDWMAFSKDFVESLGLEWNPYTTQIEPHDNQAEWFDCLARMNTILIDFSRDMWGYIARGVFKQRLLAHEVGSSTMPHKVNPIDFENAEGNLSLANALLGFMARKLPCSRFQRDLTDSTVLRNLGAAFGHTLIAFKTLNKGLSKVEPNQDAMKKDLNQSWEVLGEAVQTVMRRYNQNHAYEQLKSLSRGKALTQIDLEQFIQTLNIPPEAKEQLLDLSPETYIGLATKLSSFKLADF